MEISDLHTLWNQMKQHPITGEDKHFPIGCDGVNKEKFELNLDQQLQEIARKINQKDEAGQTTYRFGTLLYCKFK